MDFEKDLTCHQLLSKHVYFYGQLEGKKKRKERKRKEKFKTR